MRSPVVFDLDGVLVACAKRAGCRVSMVCSELSWSDRGAVEAAGPAAIVDGLEDVLPGLRQGWGNA